MKQWRVGTLSMGTALLLFGIVLFISQLRGSESFELLIHWWPVILVLLGIELLVYLGVSRKEQPIVKYDVFSILFVGVLLIAGMGAAVLTTTGMMQEIRFAISAEERSVELPEIHQKVTDEVKRVVVQNRAGSNVIVDQTADASVHVFGAYRFTSTNPGDAEPTNHKLDSLVQLRTYGDTMYIEIQRPPIHRGIRSHYNHLDVTVVLPEQLLVDVSGSYSLMKDAASRLSMSR